MKAVFQNRENRERAIYAGAFAALVLVEVLIALFVRDRFLRPYGGDILVMGVLYCFIRMFTPRGLRWLPLYLFLFAAGVEIAQAFDYVTWLGLDAYPFFKTLLGTTFAWEGILCYGVGSLGCFGAQRWAWRK